MSVTLRKINRNYHWITYGEVYRNLGNDLDIDAEIKNVPLCKITEVDPIKILEVIKYWEVNNVPNELLVTIFLSKIRFKEFSEEPKCKNTLYYTDFFEVYKVFNNESLLDLDIIFKYDRVDFIKFYINIKSNTIDNFKDLFEPYFTKYSSENILQYCKMNLISFSEIDYKKDEFHTEDFNELF